MCSIDYNLPSTHLLSAVNNCAGGIVPELCRELRAELCRTIFGAVMIRLSFGTLPRRSNSTRPLHPRKICPNVMLIREAALIVFVLIGSVRGRARSLLLLFTVFGDTYLQKNIVKLFPKQLACRGSGGYVKICISVPASPPARSPPTFVRRRRKR